MGTKRFDIKTYESFPGAIVEFKKRVYDQIENLLPISPGRELPYERGYNAFTIDLHEITNPDESTVLLRKSTDFISIELIPDLINKSVFETCLPKILNKGEKANEVLALTVRLVCPRINYVIESKRVSLEDIYKNVPIKFSKLNLNDIISKVEVQSEIIRIKSSNPTQSTVAFSSLNILSRNRTISFYVDEVDDIGGTALPINPGDTKDKMFLMKNLDLKGEPPTLVYHKQFKDFFNNGDDYKTVQLVMILIGMPYSEQLLKWIVFGNPNYEKKEHKIIIKFIADLCDKREYELKNITEEADKGKQREEYLKLSNLIFENVQSMGSGWKKMLYYIVQNEK